MLNTLLDAANFAFSRIDTLLWIAATVLSLLGMNFLNPICDDFLRKHMGERVAISQYIMHMIESVFCLVLGFMAVVGMWGSVVLVFMADFTTGVSAPVRPIFLIGAIVAFGFFLPHRLAREQKGQFVYAFRAIICVGIFFALSYVPKPAFSMSPYWFCGAIVNRIIMAMTLLGFYGSVQGCCE